MTTTWKEMKPEAIERMRMLGIRGDVVSAFDKKNNVYVCASRFAGLSDWWYGPIIKERYEQFEDEYGAMVYAALERDPHEGIAYLYVSRETDQWNDEREDIASGTPLAYVSNLKNPGLSEIGAIGIRLEKNGNIRRTF